MKFLILIHSNPESRALWEELTDEQRTRFGRGHLDLTRQLTDEGVLLSSAGLQGPETARRVSVRDGRTIAADGPFAETKEYLAGVYLVEADDLDHATALAARAPDAATGFVEVRPVQDLSWLDE
ncbi:YciI family protein [Phytomonospora endophytica]|uniref:YCII-related domain-containing protein n=1 Tax=Phytomonospora endophytica TaxID=714109 RepID=A0A841FY54_9ACTN|nr:YciI family protein [Phytomonospora endophytica]MBB6038648.1 hypothetical protein [Phytomonospora endophytica]GIG69208.1 hypothetical protein Pen01_55030 [Phytomonospora endophytica]